MAATNLRPRCRRSNFLQQKLEEVQAPCLCGGRALCLCGGLLRNPDLSRSHLQRPHIHHCLSQPCLSGEEPHRGELSLDPARVRGELIPAISSFTSTMVTELSGTGFRPQRSETRLSRSQLCAMHLCGTTWASSCRACLL